MGSQRAVDINDLVIEQQVILFCVLKRHIQPENPNYINDSLKDGLAKRTIATTISHNSLRLK